MPNTDYDSLLTDYLSVCNAALDRNKNRFPFKQILGAAKHAEKGRQIELQISDQENASYVMEIDKGQIVARPHGDCGNCECVRKWSVLGAYLENVVENPQVYIDNPAKINWEWMYDH